MNLTDLAKPLLTEASDPTIIKIQTALKNAGYDLGTSGPNGDGIDGIYGPKTKNAIMQFQSANGIKSTGFVGTQTAPKLGTPQMTPYKPKVQPQVGDIKKTVSNVAGDVKKTAAQAVKGVEKGVTQAAGDVKSKVSQVAGDVKSKISQIGGDIKSKLASDKTKEPEKTVDVNEPSGEEKEKKEGGIKRFLRKLAPNVAQMFFTKPLTGEDFTRRQKSVIYNVIQNAIKRTGNKNRGGTTYADYGGNIKETFDNNTGASLKDIITRSATDPSFQIASTLGQFSYRLQPNGVYLVTDTYDFSKAKAYTVTKDELKGKNYWEQLAYVREKDNLSHYRAARQIAYLEHPDTAPASEKTKIVVEINPKEFTKSVVAEQTRILRLL